METTEAEGLGRAALGVAGPPPPALGNAHVPAAVHPKPNGPTPGREAACGQADAPGRAHLQRCPPLRGGLLDVCLPTPPAAASSPNTTPSPDPSAPLGVPLEPLVPAFLWQPPPRMQVASRNFNESVSSLSLPSLCGGRDSRAGTQDTRPPRDPPLAPACGRAPDAGPGAARWSPATEPRGRSRPAPRRSPAHRLRRCLGTQSDRREGGPVKERLDSRGRKKSSHHATARILSKGKAETGGGGAAGNRNWQTLRRLSSFNVMGADHEGSRETETRPRLSRQSAFPRQGWTGREARLEEVGGRRPLGDPSPENIQGQRTRPLTSATPSSPRGTTALPTSPKYD